MRLYVATTNPGKLRDFAHAATDEHTVSPLPGIDSMPEPVEDADTFAGNALIKARAYSALAPGLVVLADDSGLMVRSLNCEPGVRSARYADDQGWPGPGTKDERNNACLLSRTAKLRYRDASYFCALAAVRDGQLLATSSGELEGQLLTEPRGSGGFGYDPLFDILELARTMAQLDPETRLQYSHRGRALRALLRQPFFNGHHP